MAKAVKTAAAALLALLVTAGAAAPAGAACPNEALRQQQGMLGLPNCMALEMATPPVKFNRNAFSPSFSASGNRLQFESAAPLGETEGQLSPINDTYLASRQATGWKSSATSPPAAYGFGWAGISTGGQPLAFSPELDRWFSLQSTQSQGQHGRMTAFEGDLSGTWRARSDLLTPLGPHHTIALIRLNLFNLPAVSADYSHLFVRPGDRETINKFPYSGSYLPGDPQPVGDGTGSEVDGTITWNTYVASDGPLGEHRLALLARDADGKAWGGNCGAFVGGGGNESISGGRNQGAVSADGRHVYFSARPAQVESAPCPTVGTADVSAGVNTVTVTGSSQPFSVGQEIVATEGIPLGTRITSIAGQALTLSAPPTVSRLGAQVKARYPLRILERTENANGEATIDELQPAEPLAGADYYEGASIDQTKVYFTSSRKLAPTDQDPVAKDCTGEVKLPLATSVGCDLYLYEKLPGGGSQTIQVSAGGVGDPSPGVGANVYGGVTAISGDGSHVYFTAQGVLTTDPNPEGAVAQAGELNLYLYERSTAYPSGRTTFIGELDAAGPDPTNVVGDETNISQTGAVSAVPMKGIDGGGVEVGGDGHMLLFRSTASLTADDQDGGHVDLFRYDAGAEALVCVSCLPGGAGDGAQDVVTAPKLLQNPGPEFAEYRRWASEDGTVIAFGTKEALLSEDVDGELSDYLWQDGTLTLLPGFGGNPVISHDGNSVAFQTPEPLLPQDGDSAIDVYVGRMDGGFPFQHESAPCSGEACQGSPAPASGPLSVGSNTFAGPGNVKPSGKTRKPRQNKRKRRKQRAGKKHQHDAKNGAARERGRR